MSADFRAESLRRASNPLYNDRKLKLGTFSTNLSGGCAITTIDGTLKAEWAATLDLAEVSDSMGFEALVPVGRWAGFGGETNFNGAGFESFTWAAGIGAQVKKSGIFATSHVPSIHPIMAAKQGMTIDHITGGRFTLNIVTGWNKPEIEMFGADLLDHDTRYDMAEEWLAIIKRLWTEDDPVNFDGRFYRIRNGMALPKPIQKPYPVIMNAGGSERGRHYAARFCDVAFCLLDSHDYEKARAFASRYRDLAREEYGREIQVWTYGYIVEGETEKEAREFYNYYVHEKGDWTAARNLVSGLIANAQTLPPHILSTMHEHFIAGWGGIPFVGTREQIVESLQKFSQSGYDGILLSWPRYQDGIRQFAHGIHPMLQQAGLR
jgi:alkanesulfonate monooxygenase SsuD/methylene tetrahydromethanopterin reductase-like flavin-dependent oxidoreductase (luciferase family)